ncbi:MAG: NAD(P)/FAD-dependent oxidoreductase [Gemmatimonadales bacterium]|nr:MAG: NAD(P)/FAD-dependent oxidoreductase [Gemmatimonadales bacterium]
MSQNRPSDHHEVLIVGAGAAGISVASRLLDSPNPPRVTLLDPATRHYYQPLWTLVGAGVVPKEESMREMADLMPWGAQWIQEAAARLDPDENVVVTTGGRILTYDYLVVCPGLQINWGAVPGLEEALGSGGVCSNYDYDQSEYTWTALQELSARSGPVRALFTQPAGAFKCGGAPQKIMYLVADHLRLRGRLKDAEVHFFHPGTIIFGVPQFARTLHEVIERYGIDTHFGHELVEVRPDSKEAVFRTTDEGGDPVERVEAFDFLHVTPPQGPPDVVRESLLADPETGWVEADRHTLRHPRYGNVFSLGDASGAPNAKTGAAIRKQAPVVAENLLAVRSGRPLDPGARYDGYASCPLITGYGKLVLAEFDYDNEPAPSFPFDTSQERYSMWVLKKDVLPRMYWHGMLKGRA